MLGGVNWAKQSLQECYALQLQGTTMLWSFHSSHGLHSLGTHSLKDIRCLIRWIELTAGYEIIPVIPCSFGFPYFLAYFNWIASPHLWQLLITLRTFQLLWDSILKSLQYSHKIPYDLKFQKALEQNIAYIHSVWLLGFHKL